MIPRPPTGLAGIIASRNAEDAATLAPIYDRLEREISSHDSLLGRIRTRLAKVPLPVHRPSKETSDRMLVVYFARSGDFVKIGKSTDWRERLLALQTGSPHPVLPLLVLPATRHTERKLHIQFKAHRVSGEWFLLSDEIVSYIEEQKMENLLPGLLK